MFELGRSLRDARRLRGAELADAERATRIRRRYLEALEEERFDLLPAPAYARGFLRAYAEYLGLDGNLYAAEYDERFAPEDEAPLVHPPIRQTSRLALPGGFVVLLIAVVVAAIGLAAWSLGGGSKHSSGAPPTTVEKPVQHHARHAAKPKPKAAKTHPALPPKPLVLTASRGDCWLEVRVGSPNGPVVYEETLKQGATVAFGLRRPLVIRVGAGSNLDARANGKAIVLPHLVGDIVVTRNGVG